MTAKATILRARSKHAVRSFVTRAAFRRAIRASDVFLVGHPKSGNTWLAYMLGHLLAPTAGDALTLANLSEYLPYVHGRDGEIERWAGLPAPRVFRNEWPLFPDGYPRSIYVVRDPRGAIVSYYHHYRAVSGSSETLHSFVDRYLADGCIADFEPLLSRWDVQVEQWLALEDRQPVLIVRYEDLAQDRSATMRAVVSFLRLEPESSVFDAAVARGDFSAMRHTEMAYGAESYPGAIGERGRFIRKGTVDGWREELSSAAAERIVEVFAAPMRALGYGAD